MNIWPSDERIYLKPDHFVTPADRMMLFIKIAVDAPAPAAPVDRIAIVLWRNEARPE